MEDPDDRLIVALDVPTADRAIQLMTVLRGMIGMVKIGSQLFTACGPSIVREATVRGFQVFLDLKFHDIPNTVAAACLEAARLGVFMCNVHASGGSEMMRAAHDRIADEFLKNGVHPTKLIAVTVLTSSGTIALDETGVAYRSVGSHIIKLAQLAEDSGMNGVVASGQMVKDLRQHTRPGFLIVTPGVRLPGGDVHDQKQVTTPAEALISGADYVVAGREIIDAADPQRVVARYLDHMATATLAMI